MKSETLRYVSLAEARQSHKAWIRCHALIEVAERWADFRCVTKDGTFVMLDNRTSKESIGKRIEALDNRLQPNDWEWLRTLAGVIVTDNDSPSQPPMVFTDFAMLVEYWEDLHRESGVRISDEDQEMLNVIHPDEDEE